jgi:hypothetical protein
MMAIPQGTLALDSELLHTFARNCMSLQGVGSGRGVGGIGNVC